MRYVAPRKKLAGPAAEMGAGGEEGAEQRRFERLLQHGIATPLTRGSAREIGMLPAELAASRGA